MLLPETPFPRDYCPSRHEVKKVVSQLQKFLGENHPHSIIAFSVNEALKDRRSAADGKVVEHASHSNTGYLVSASKYAAYPKLVNAFSDDEGMVNRNPKLSYAQAKEAGERTWQRRSRRIKSRAQAFPQVTLFGRHEVQYRNCADAMVDHSSPQVILVSAQSLPNKHLKNLAARGALVLVNDLHYSRKLFHLNNPEGVYLNSLKNTSKSWKKLEEEMVRVHMVD